MSTDQHELNKLAKRMQDPSWLILHALSPVISRTGIEIIHEIRDMLRAAGYPEQLRPSAATLHYALKRMAEDGLVRQDGPREVEVPGRDGTTHHEWRTGYVLEGLGSKLLDHREMLLRELALRRASAGPAWQLSPVGSPPGLD